MQLLRILAIAVCLLLPLAPAYAAADDYPAAHQLYKQGQSAEALKRLEALLQVNPRDARARFLRGVILTEQKRTDEAIEVFTGLTQEFPELSEPYNNLAVIHASRGDYVRAREALETAVRANPGHATAQENLGDIYALLAAQSYDKAVKLDKANRSAPTKLALIRQAVPTSAASTALSETAAPEVPATPIAVQPGTNASNSAPSTSLQAGQDRQQVSDPQGSTSIDPAAMPVLKTVEDWAAAWSRADAQAYLSFYAPDFKPATGETRAKWEASRRERLTRGQRVSVGVSGMKVSFTDADHALASFKQDYVSESLKRSTRKSLQLQRHGDRWLITRETIAKN